MPNLNRPLKPQPPKLSLPSDRNDTAVSDSSEPKAKDDLNNRWYIVLITIMAAIVGTVVGIPSAYELFTGNRFCEFIHSCNATDSILVVAGTTVPTPDLTATADYSSRLLYLEDFEDGEAQNIRLPFESWEIVSENSSNKVYELDTLQYSLYRKFTIPEDTFQDFILEFRWRSLKVNPAYTYSPTLTVSFSSIHESVSIIKTIDFYASGDERLRLFEYSHLQGNEPAGILTFERDLSLQSRKWYSIRIENGTANLRIFIDDILIGEEFGTHLPSSITFEANYAIVQIDDIRILNPIINDSED